MFRDVMATCGRGGACYVKNDSPFAFKGTLTLSSTNFRTAAMTTLLTTQLDLPAGAGAVRWLQVPAVGGLDGTQAILEAALTDANGAPVSRNVIPLATPEKMVLRPAHVSVSASRAADGGFEARVRAEAVAVFVTLTTLAHGRFEDNAFLLRPPGRIVHFLPLDASPHEHEEAFEVFSQSLRVEDVSMYRTLPDRQFV